MNDFSLPSSLSGRGFTFSGRVVALTEFVKETAPANLFFMAESEAQQELMLANLYTSVVSLHKAPGVVVTSPEKAEMCIRVLQSRGHQFVIAPTFSLHRFKDDYDILTMSDIGVTQVFIMSDSKHYNDDIPGCIWNIFRRRLGDALTKGRMPFVFVDVLPPTDTGSSVVMASMRSHFPTYFVYETSKEKFQFLDRGRHWPDVEFKSFQANILPVFNERRKFDSYVSSRLGIFERFKDYLARRYLAKGARYCASYITRGEKVVIDLNR
ncbi:hypothetical protein ACYPKM_01100 [Pseudomonas aeruginosa]